MCSLTQLLWVFAQMSLFQQELPGTPHLTAHTPSALTSLLSYEFSPEAFFHTLNVCLLSVFSVGLEAPQGQGVFSVVHCYCPVCWCAVETNNECANNTRFVARVAGRRMPASSLGRGREGIGGGWEALLLKGAWDNSLATVCPGAVLKPPRAEKSSPAFLQYFQ